jgi:hypothetical protein
MIATDAVDLSEVDPTRIFRLTQTQGVFWTADETYQNLEGAVRSGKTTICLLKVGNRCETFPGLHAMISRWHEKDTNAQLKARFKELFGDRCTWNAEEQYFEFVQSGSRVYVRGLKPSEGESLFSKFAGLTLGLIYLDQPEEVPFVIFEALKARLSQRGMPNELYLSPNPPDEDHWLAGEFPLPDSQASDLVCRPGYRYIRTTVYDNATNLPDGYIGRLERDYPPGHVLRRRFIEGRRGLSVVGTPVYKGYFDRARHVVHEPGDWETAPSALFDPALPLYESWDWGHSSPCVTWHQLQHFGAQWVVLGGVQGRNCFLEDFAPGVLAIRAAWFPTPVVPLPIGRLASDFERYRRQRDRGLNVQSVGDPAGATNNSQGTNRSAVTVLAEMGIIVTTQPDANHIERRNYAIQTFAGYLERSLPAGVPCFRISDRFLVIGQESGVQARSLLVDGFEAGYVWDVLSSARTASPNTRRPKKDGVFDHSMNTCEYAALQWAPASPASLAGTFHTDTERIRAGQLQAREARRQLRLAQRDDEESFHWPRHRVQRVCGRGGY